MLVARADPGDQLRAGARTRARSRSASASIAVLAADRASSSGSGGPRNPLYDLHVAARRIFWVAALRRHHRVRLADGRDVHRPAVPAERARLLDARRRRGDPAGRRSSWCSSRRARRSSSRRAGARFTLLARLRVLPARLRLRCCCSGTRASPTGRSAWRTPSSASASASPARRRRTRSPARCPVRRAGMASGTADLQRDLGGAIMQSIFGALLTAGLRGGGRGRDRRVAATRRQVSDSVAERAHEVVLERRGHRRSSTRSTPTRSSRPRRRRSSTATTGPTRPGIIAIAARRARSSSSCSRARSDEERAARGVPRGGHRGGRSCCHVVGTDASMGDTASGSHRHREREYPTVTRSSPRRAGPRPSRRCRGHAARRRPSSLICCTACNDGSTAVSPHVGRVRLRHVCQLYRRPTLTTGRWQPAEGQATVRRMTQRHLAI